MAGNRGLEDCVKKGNRKSVRRMELHKVVMLRNCGGFIQHLLGVLRGARQTSSPQKG